MSDAEALATGDEARAARAHGRNPDSLRTWLEGLLGQVVFIEGIRINYRGKLARIIWRWDGAPEGLVFDRLERISYMEKTAPNANYTFEHRGERFVPWDCVHDIGKESFGWR